MNTDRIKQRLGVETSKKSVNTDTYLKINIDGQEKLLPPDEINHIVNVGERFNIERQRSKYYRILGTINPTMTNALFNLNNPSNIDLYTWAGFNYRASSAPYDFRFLDTSYPKDADLADNTDLTYSQALKKFLLERDGWFGYIDPDKTQAALCNYFDMEPKRERVSFVPDIAPFSGGTTPVKNWELTITYPKTTDKTHNMVAGGLLMIEAEEAIVSNRSMVAFGMPCLHNLSIGSIVKITGTTAYNGTHVVVRTGQDNGDLKGYYFVIDLPYVPGAVGGSSRMIRTFNGKDSEYYFRKFRKVKTKASSIIENDDYETYKLAFSESIFNDSITQFVFNEDIDVSDLTDNLGRPVSELYLTTVKTSSAGLFGQVSAGIETPFIPELNTSSINTFLLNIPAINKIHNGGATPFQSHTALSNNVTIGDYDYYGDLVEYNENEVKETILADVSHRYNTLNRETGPTMAYYSTLGSNPAQVTTSLGPRQEGYFYKAHSLITIREFSSYVETGDKFTEGIPDYAVSLSDGRYLWRDILDIGFNESNDIALDYPFLNGAHYMYNNYCFHVRRQDPFSHWNLFWANFPADPLGESVTDNYNTNSDEDVC
jgi:hypothetical protein